MEWLIRGAAGPRRAISQIDSMVSANVVVPVMLLIALCALYAFFSFSLNGHVQRRLMVGEQSGGQGRQVDRRLLEDAPKGGPRGLSLGSSCFFGGGGGVGWPHIVFPSVLDNTHTLFLTLAPHVLARGCIRAGRGGACLVPRRGPSGSGGRRRCVCFFY